MKRHIIAGAGVVAALALASAPATAGPSDPPIRPLTGSVVTQDTMGPPDGCTMPDAMWSFSGEGPGTFSHLGTVWFEIEHCSAFTGPTTGVFGGGTITVTAANGDQLFMTEEGSFELVLDPTNTFPISSLIELEWEIVGGTGRFVGATGEGTANPIGDLVGGTTSATLTGTIAYDASNRAQR
ncbi:hypothetical protein GA707_06050 [Nostocoides sp. F2B08]|uniref:hypothetical protein n=1 Tax=Nostocoides sp. F2B08 TaxID=2653936 RepID=UPI00126360DC|nr:hypothetical protein [Tetrasphaera sp. F2B08]KAB7745482.1 hypothetical protein GA707_06050 [Tetrasphaera sp. F2B08]